MKIKIFELFTLLLLTSLTTVFIWIQLNMRYVSEWFDQNYLLNIMITSPIIGLVSYAYYGKAVEYFNSLWSAKLVAYAIGIVIFAILSWAFIGESPFELKTILCIILSFAILGIQILL